MPKLANFINTTLDPSQQAAYLQLCRHGAGFMCFKPNQGKFYEKHFHDHTEALALIAANGANADTWVSMATYSDPNASRSQNNAEGLCALWLDVDAHEGGAYETVQEVEAALQGFLFRTALPKPTLLHFTGYGVHAIWVFNQVIKRDEWQPVALKLQDLAERMFLGADPITADAARILRLPGTLNFRDSENPRLALFEETGIDSHGFDDIESAIDQALAKLPPLIKTRGLHTSSKNFDCPETNPNIDLVKVMLSTINPDIGYCEWRDVVWAVAATGWDCSYELAHTWSSKGATWDEDVFIRVWDSFDDSRGIGFGTLAHHAKSAGYLGALPTKSQTQQFKLSGRLVTVCAADIQPENVEWLVDQSFPLGMVAALGGPPGMGKSQISINLAAGVTTGKGLPGTGSFINLGSVIFLANEDDAARTIRPRLDAAGADIDRVHIVQGVARDGVDIDLFQLDSDIADLSARAAEIGDVRLIVIDPPTAYLGTKVDSYKDSDVRRVLAPLTKLAQTTGAMVLLVVHLNKRTEGSAQQRFSGSTAWTAVPRVAFLVAEDCKTKQRFMLPAKNNVGDDKLGYGYHISEKLIKYAGQTFKSSYIVWDQLTNRSVDELISAPRMSKVSVVDDAKSFLEDELSDGPKSVGQIRSLANAAGLSWASVNRAKQDMPISSNKVGDGWTWTLLSSKVHTTEDAKRQGDQF